MINLLDKAKAPRLTDFFSLDVEGFEDQVIKGIDFDKYNFLFFLAETKSDAITDLLKKKYVLIKKLSQHDILFKYIR